MKLLARLLLGVVAATAAISSRNGGNVLRAAETSAPPERIGIYDSRVIAYAHFWSAGHQRELNERVKAARAAKATGQKERFDELEAAIQNAQKTNHLQVFSTAPVDDVLDAMKDRLPAIQKQAGVAKLVSKWDEAALKKYPRANQVEVTELLLGEFKLDERKMKVAQDIRKKTPLPLDQAHELMRKGKL